jgi:chromosome segregation ATPase
MLLQRLLAQNPQSKYRGEALDRLALIESMLRQRDSITAERQGLDDRIAQLTTETKRLRASLDSATSRNDSLQHAMTRVEADLKDREDQLRALRLELARLKQIDLNQRPAARPPRF